jgi:hypothetical protein
MRKCIEMIKYNIFFRNLKSFHVTRVLGVGGEIGDGDKETGRFREKQDWDSTGGS